MAGASTINDQGNPTERTLRKSSPIDWIERLTILGLYGWLCARIVVSFAAQGGIVNLLLLPSEGLVVALILVRRGTNQISRRPLDWALAFSATTVPLLVQPGVGDAVCPLAVAGVLMLMGIILQVHAKVALGRSIGCVPANRGLKFGGPYRYVRHPMYLGYLVTHLAFLLVNPTPWNLTVYAICYAFQVPRLLAEERLLRQDADYLDYMQKVRYRLVPGVF